MAFAAQTAIPKPVQLLDLQHGNLLGTFTICGMAAIRQPIRATCRHEKVIVRLLAFTTQPMGALSRSITSIRFHLGMR
jgi:hypothetical protein